MAGDIERFNEQIERFKKKTHPVTFLDLMAKDVAKNLFGGFCYALNMRVSVKYADEFPVTIENLKSYNPMGTRDEKELTVFHPVCRQFRVYLGHDDVYVRWTHRVGLRYYEGTWKRPKMYHSHMNLWDMAYPIWIEENLLGVIFGGETLVKDEAVRWREELREIIESVVWDIDNPEKEVPEQSNQVDDVVRALREKAETAEITAVERRELEDIVRIDANMRNVGAKGVVSRFQGFLRFGQMVENLLRELHEARKDGATRRLMQAAAGYLAAADLCDRESWAKHAERMFLIFCKTSGIDQVHVYTRRQARFERWVPYEGSKGHLVRARDILPVVPVNKLQRLRPESKTEKHLLQALGLGLEDVWVFRSENRTQGGILASLIALRGEVKSDNRELAESFCRTVGMRSDIASPVFMLGEQQAAFKLRVGEMAHAFRTPVQGLLFDLENLRPLARDDEDMSQLIDESMDLLIGAREDIRGLLEEVRERWEDCNLIELVDEVLRELRPAAKAHLCLVTKEGVWPEEIMVRVNRSRIRRAFMALVDNAIKYSWRGKVGDRLKGTYRVRIWAEVDEGNLVRVCMRNYGIGIPPDALDRIRELGERAMVPDAREARKGTGWGLYVATSAFNEHGGCLGIESYPADDGPRAPGEEYHRYVTEVTAYLPLQM
ncbi:MAG: sensor histidine kinase [Planctomycetota bacterium]|jgi:signal transduction histidine kinase